MGFLFAYYYMNKEHRVERLIAEHPRLRKPPNKRGYCPNVKAGGRVPCVGFCYWLETSFFVCCVTNQQ